jgi:hypothetical protein
MSALLLSLVSFVCLILSIIIMSNSSKLKSSSDTLTADRANTIYNAGTGIFVISAFGLLFFGMKLFSQHKDKFAKYNLSSLSHYL